MAAWPRSTRPSVEMNCASDSSLPTRVRYPRNWNAPRGGDSYLLHADAAGEGRRLGRRAEAPLLGEDAGGQRLVPLALTTCSARSLDLLRSPSLAKPSYTPKGPLHTLVDDLLEIGGLLRLVDLSLRHRSRSRAIHGVEVEAQNRESGVRWRYPGAGDVEIYKNPLVGGNNGAENIRRGRY